jgi:hypothetical protein
MQADDADLVDSKGFIEQKSSQGHVKPAHAGGKKSHRK